MKEAFEMVVINFVLLPMTRRGYVGMVVIMNQKSKFVYAVAVKNKKRKILLELGV